VKDFDLLAASAELGQEFVRRGMVGHAADLRKFYAELRARRERRRESGDRSWDEDMVVGWLCLLRIPPFDHVYPLRPRGEPCVACGEKGGREAPGVFVRVAAAGVRLVQCQSCGEQWLHEEAAADAG
jgi:hypothetical protein